MIYQHRLVVARGGRLEKRHIAFQSAALDALDAHGSLLIGAWEVCIGPDAGCAVYQLRQFESMTDWEKHQNSVRRDRELLKERSAKLYPHLDLVDTIILRMSDDMPPLPETWPTIDAVRGQPRGYIEQRILHFRPGGTTDHHALYRERLLPALKREGAELIGLFDTVIGPGTMNANSHCSIELRRFPDLASRQRWQEAQDTDPELRQLVKSTWLSHIVRVDGMLLRPLDYSKIR